MKFYHVSIDVFEDIKLFTPRIPSSTMPREDVNINRICVSTSIEDCLNGIQYFSILRESLFLSSEDNYSFIDNTNRVVKVYEFEYSKNNIKTPEDINHLVPDSIQTNEYWILENLEPIDSYIINITDIKTEFDCKSNYEPYKITNIKYDIVSISDISSTAILTIANKEMLNEIYNENTLSIPLILNENSLIIKTKNFPLLKEHYKNILTEYFDWTQFKSLEVS